MSCTKEKRGGTTLGENRVPDVQAHRQSRKAVNILHRLTLLLALATALAAVVLWVCVGITAAFDPSRPEVQKPLARKQVGRQGRSSAFSIAMMIGAWEL